MARFGYKGPPRGGYRGGKGSALSSREQRRAYGQLRRMQRRQKAKEARSAGKLEELKQAAREVAMVPPVNFKEDPRFMEAVLARTLGDHGLEVDLRPEVIVCLPQPRLGVPDVDHINRIEQLIIAVRDLHEIFDGGRYAILVLPNLE